MIFALIKIEAVRSQFSKVAFLIFAKTKYEDDKSELSNVTSFAVMPLKLLFISSES